MPPPWFVHTAWRVHRALNRLSGGRFLWTPANKRGWGALRLTTLGHRSGRERSVIIGYLDDGDDLVALAMNGWDEADPAWWRNLQAHPEATVELARHETRRVRARAAQGEERDRLWRLGTASSRTWTATRPDARPPPRWWCSSRRPSRPDDACGRRQQEPRQGPLQRIRVFA